MHVEIAADLRGLHQFRQRACLGHFNFTDVLAQFRRYPRKAQLLVHALFGFACHLLVGVGPKQPVLAQLETHPYRSLAQRYVVFFASRKVLQRRSVTGRVQGAHIHLQSFAAQFDAGLIFAAAQNFLHARMTGNNFQCRRRVRTGNQKVQVADCFLAAPQASGRRHPVHTRNRLQRLGQFARRSVCHAEQETAGTQTVLRNAPQNLLFQFGAHARQIPQFLVYAELLQFVDAFKVGMLQQGANAFWSQALNSEEFQRGGRKFLQQGIAPFATASGFDFPQHHGEPFTHALNFCYGPVGICQDIGDPLGVAFNRGRGIAVTADTKSVFLANLHQVGGFVEDAADFAVFQVFSLAAALRVKTWPKRFMSTRSPEISTPSRRRRSFCSIPDSPGSRIFPPAPRTRCHGTSFAARSAHTT